MPLILILTLLGLCFGSFLSALVDRDGTNKSIWRGRSACVFCRKKIWLRDLLPVFNFFLLRGCCRFCKKPIGWKEPTIEIVSGLIFLAVGLVHHGIFGLELVRDLIFSIFFILFFLIDWRLGLLPYRFTLIGTIVALMFNLGTQNFVQLQIIFGMIVCGGFFYLQHLVSRGRWVGGGDAGMGLYIGAVLGLTYGLWALGLAYIIGAFFALFLLATKKATMKSQIPFGPFLAIAGWIILLIRV